MIEIRHLSLTYDRPLLNNASIDLFPGEITLIRGESGSGKTALLYRIGLISNKTDFYYSIDDINIFSMTEEKRRTFQRSHIAYVLQDALLFNHYTIYQNIYHSAKINNIEMSERMAIDLLKKVRLSIDLHRTIEHLSGGERQRLAIACALAKKPSLLILDEPCSALDSENEVIIYEILKELAKEHIYILLSSHRSKTMEYANRIYEIQHQQLVCLKESPQELNPSRNISTKQHHVGNSLYHYYTKHFKVTYKKMRLFLQIGLLLCVFLTSLIYLLVEHNIKENTQLLNQISYNQLFISEDSLYIDGIFQKPFNEEINHPLIQSIYPVYLCTLPTYQGVCYIVPFYEENNFSEYVKETNSENNVGIYYDESFFSQLVEYIENDSFLINDQKYPVLSQLYEGYNCSYINNSLYILMDHSSIDSLNIPKTPIGYTVFCEHVEDLSVVERDFTQLGYQVNNHFQKGEQLSNIITSLNRLRLILTIVVTLVLLIFITLIHYHYFELRKKEIALLKINGLSNQNVRYIFSTELIDLSISSYLLPIVLVTLISFILFKQLPLLFMIYLMVVYLLQFLLSYFINAYLTSALNPEQILRN